MMRTVCTQALPFICYAAFGLMLSPLAQSTTLALLSLAQLVESTQIVVHAKAISNDRLWRDGEIWTVTTFRVMETWKGASPSEISVWMIGGHVDRIMSYVPGAPRFRPGEETILFLEHTRDGELSITAWGEGTFRIRLDTRTGEARATQDTAIAPEYDAATHTFQHPGIRDWPLATLKLRVLEIESEQGGTK